MMGLRGARYGAATGAVVSALVLFTAGCQPSGQEGGAAGKPSTTVTSAPAVAATESAPPLAATPAAPTSHPAAATEPTPVHTTPARATAPTSQPPAPASTAPEPPEATRPAATPAGGCAPHTTGSCGWDHGLTPASPGETAECVDGTVSESAHFQGTCSQHHGVLYWFK
ncbi:DUF3761 domain-containing protein [Kitasatospora sp. NPDC052896]|uniref:DUF3761 domain-containing protein n=1 Tax=Kitasatospora sp. NPDC052896 TaxID=3364061 RepID=UPI0037CC743E